ncbi:HigA family addiction module antitoxin [Rhodococcus erythropolis]
MGVAPTRKIRVIPTGSYIEEWLDDNVMTQTELAERLDVSRKHLNQVIRGKVAVSDALASRLELVTGTPATYWMRMEAAYQNALQRARDEETYAAREQEFRAFPVAALRQRGFVENTWRNPSALVGELLRLFNAGTPDALLALLRETAPAAAFRQSTAHKIVPESVFTWLRVGELVAERHSITVGAFAREKLETEIPAIRALSTLDPQQYGSMVQHQLALVGVRLVLVPDFPGARAHGATRLWRGKPLVQLSDRYKRDDIFWFTLFHELSHVLYDDLDQLHINWADKLEEPDEERADRWAGETLIPQAVADALPKLLTPSQVVAFAKEIGVAPGIVAGRLCYDKLWKHSKANTNNLLRFIAINGAETD